jgi:curved DNA-binding protein CbpA
MQFGAENSSYYDLLELTPGASPQEIRSAYLRLKAAYSKDSVALYSLIGKDEMEQIAKKVEEAYLILSQPDKKRAYDIAQGLISPMAIDPIEEQQVTSSFQPATKVIPAVSGPTYAKNETPSVTASSAGKNEADIDRMCQDQKEWAGAFLKQVREARGITLDELSDFTRISRIYLKSIEDEEYGKLPAAVYLRGFLIQIAKRLKINQEVFVNQYLARFKSARPDKA